MDNRNGRAMHARCSLSKNFFDRLTEVKEASKTNKSNPSAYDGTLGFDL